MVVGGSRRETLDPGFVLLSTRQQSVPVTLRELVLPDGTTVLSYYGTFSNAYLRSHTRDTESHTSTKRPSSVSVFSMMVYLKLNCDFNYDKSFATCTYEGISKKISYS
ncbi:unnamed protein product [Schistosoma margrebowiei]|uniref:Uncharacterized protein n=1 Tax=Schistosoma margrebowiei TaxID=48269 RepID=A0A183MD12_9TREM|nr:unnamed protein product [Schistosoma margrebowiei]